MKFSSLILAGFASAALGLFACGGDDNGNATNDGGSQDATADSTSHDASTDAHASDAAGDAAASDSSSDAATDSPTSADSAMGDGATPLNGCTTFVDDTAAANPTITGPMGVNPVQYAPSCVKIKAGQSVTWKVAFANHPLEQAGGDANSPIANANTGTSVTFQFPNAGEFGFECAFHPTIMFGAVLVVP
jgi:plastocyanin